METTTPQPQPIWLKESDAPCFSIDQHYLSAPVITIVQDDGAKMRFGIPNALFRAALDDYVRHQVSCQQMNEWMDDPTFDRVRIRVVREGMAAWFTRRARQHAIPRLHYTDAGVTFLDGEQAAHSYTGSVVDAEQVRHWVTGFGSTKKAAEHDAMMQAREIMPDCEKTDMYTGEDQLWGH